MTPRSDPTEEDPDMPDEDHEVSAEEQARRDNLAAGREANHTDATVYAQPGDLTGVWEGPEVDNMPVLSDEDRAADAEALAYALQGHGPLTHDPALASHREFFVGTPPGAVPLPGALDPRLYHDYRVDHPGAHDGHPGYIPPQY